MMEKKRILLLSLVLVLSGCSSSVVPPKDPSPLTHINVSLEEGKLQAEKAIKSGDVSEEMSQSLMQLSSGASFSSEDEKRFDLSVKEVPAKSFFMSLAEGTPYNMLLHPDIDGSITLELNNVTVPEVLESVRKLYGYEYKDTGVGFEIFPVQLQTKVYKLDYLFIARSGESNLKVGSSSLTDSSNSSGSTSSSNSSNSSRTSQSSNSSELKTKFSQNIWDEIGKVLSSLVGTDQGQQISMSPQSGTVMVKAMPKELRSVEEFLYKTQTSLNRQVILEAKILEISLSDGNQQGINWGSVLGRFSMAQIGGGSTLTGTGLSAATKVSNSAGSAVNVGPGEGFPANGASTLFGGVFSAAIIGNNFSTILEFLSSQGNVQVLSSPRISTLNNQKAIIKIGDDSYFVTNVTSATNNSGTTSTTNASINLQPFFSGIALDVTPFIDVNGNVTLHVHPTITEVTEVNKTIVVNGENQVLPLAHSTIRESDSVIRAQSGQIVVIGGLMKNEMTEVSTSVPYLGRIPFLGNLFRHSNQQKEKRELVILLKPVVLLSGGGEERDLLEDAQRRLNRLDRGFYHGPQVEMFGNIRETQAVP